MFNSSANSFVFNLIKSKPIYLIASFILSFGSTISDIFAILLLTPILLLFLNNSIDLSSSNASSLIKFLLNINNIFPKDNQLLILIALIVLAKLVNLALTYCISVVSIKYTQYLIYEIKIRSFNLLGKVNFHYYVQNRARDILFKINREIDKTAIAIKSWQKILIISLSIATVSLILILISLPLTLMAIALIGLILLFNNWAIAWVRKRELLLAQKFQTYNHQVIEFLTGIKYIQTTANENQEYEKIIKSIKYRNQAEINTQTSSALINFIHEFAKIMIIIILTFGSYYFYGSQIQIFISIALTYILVLFKLLSLINQLNNARNQFINNKSSIKIVVDFLNKVSKPIIKSGNIAFTNLQNRIELKNVTFAYPNHAQIVLDKINLNINQGQTIALIGAAGSGKSTLVSLLFRLYEPIEGKIMLDGKDIAEYSLSSLRKSMLVIDQEVFLFTESIFYNLTYGLENISLADVLEAAKKTQAYDFIAQLPQDFSSKVGSGAIKLSELQKQLITITRGILCNPELVILDNPMANLSQFEQKIVQNALNELCRDRTTIIITNLLTSIKKADCILILSKGKLTASGTHQELLNNCDLYQRMCSAQFKTSQQSHQQILAKKISQKLNRQTHSNLSYEIRNNLNSLLNYLQLVNQGLVEDNLDQERILDESYQSAKNMLASLREYERKISQKFNQE